LTVERKAVTSALPPTERKDAADGSSADVVSVISRKKKHRSRDVETSVFVDL
jgi:hypothetical protein